jgi:hypothetical protein
MLPSNPQDPNKPKQPQAAPGQPQQPAASSGRFTNLQKYMKANAPGELAGKVSGRIEQGAQQAGQKVNEAAQAFQQAAQQNRLSTGENKQFAQQQIQQAGQGQVSDQDAQKFQGIASGGYRGPTGLQNAQALAARAQSAESLGRATATEGGRQAVLGQLFGRASYGAGQQKLDNLLLGAGGGLQQLRQARAQAQGLTARAAQEAQKAEQLGQAYKTEDEGFRQKVQEDLRGAGQAVDTTVAQRVEALNKAAPQELAAAKAELKAFQEGGAPISQRTADLLGLTEGASTYGADLAGLLRQGQSATRANAATVEEARRAQALAQLGGNVVNLQDLSGSYDPTKAQSYKSIEADTAALNPLLEDSRSQYQRDADKRRDELLGWTARFNQHAYDAYNRVEAARNQVRKQVDDASKAFDEAAKDPSKLQSLIGDGLSIGLKGTPEEIKKQYLDRVQKNALKPFSSGDDVEFTNAVGGWERTYADASINNILANLNRGAEQTVLGAEKIYDRWEKSYAPRVQFQKELQALNEGKTGLDRLTQWDLLKQKSDQLMKRQQDAYSKWDTARNRKVAIAPNSSIGPNIQNIISGGQ